METILLENKEKIIALAHSYGASNLRIFGSFARNQAGEDSDIDLLVTIERGRTLLDLVALTEDLEELTGRKVQVVTDNGISPFLKERIISEAVPL